MNCTEYKLLCLLQLNIIFLRFIFASACNCSLQFMMRLLLHLYVCSSLCNLHFPFEIAFEMFLFITYVEQVGYDVLRYNFLYDFCALGSQNFLDIWFIVLMKYLKISSIISSDIFFLSLPLRSVFRDFNSCILELELSLELFHSSLRAFSFSSLIICFLKYIYFY